MTLRSGSRMKTDTCPSWPKVTGHGRRAPHPNVVPEPGSHRTHRWSKADSNSGSHPRATPPAATRFVADSALEGGGFEPSVPGAKEPVSLLRKANCGGSNGGGLLKLFLCGYRWFESISLQRRV